MLGHATELPVAKEVQSEVDSIREHRRLLDDPDHIPGFVAKLTDSLRTALNVAHASCTSQHASGLEELELSEVWKKITPEQRYELLSQNGVRKMPDIAVGTTSEVLNTLRQTKLSEFDSIVHALPTRFSSAVTAAAKLLEPKAQTVLLPSMTIRNDEDLAEWVRQRATLHRLAQFFDVYVEALNEMSGQYVLGMDMNIIADKMLDAFNEYRETGDSRKLETARKYAALLKLDGNSWPALSASEKRPEAYF